MKKKLFLIIAMIATLMCLLAITSFAATPDTTRETFTLSDNTVLPIWDTDGNGLIWYKSTLNTEDGYANYDYVANNQTDTSTTPYITVAKGGPYSRGAGGKNYSGYQLNSITITDTSGSYSSKSEKIVLANMQNMMFDANNKFNMFAESFRNSKALEAVYFDTTVDLFLLTLSFENCGKLTYTNLEHTKVLEIGGDGCFSNCSSLVIKLPNTIKTLGHYPFQNTAIVEFTIPESVDSITGSCMFKSCAKLEKVHGFVELFERGVLTKIPGGTFENCAKLEMPFENGEFPDGITEIGSTAFYGCTSIGTTIILPNSVEKIGQSAFNGCTSLEKVVLGASFTTWTSYDGFKNCSKLKEVWIPASMTSIAGNVFNVAASDCVFYFTGTKDQLDTVKTNTNSNNTAFLNAYNQSISWSEFQALETKSGRYIVYGVNKCYAFYNNKHTVTGTNCTVADTCKNCQLPIEAQAEHIFSETLTYVSFVQNGVYTRSCTFYGCTAANIKAGDEGSVKKPLFGGGEGFSTKGADGIAGGYTIDIDAVNEYKRINGSLTVGIMVVNPNYLKGKDSFLDAQGKVNTTGGALQVNIAENQYKNVSVAITGFVGNAESVSLVIALYAYDDIENVEFVQSSTTACGDKNVIIGDTTLYTVTLASVKAGNSNLSSLGDYVMPSDEEEQE